MSERILIVDDETSVLDILSQLLTPHGYDCDVTDSPKKALNRLKKDSYSLLLTDIKMPEMNGIDVVKQARAQDGSLAIIVVTALTDVSNAIEAIRAGADDYVLKPFNLRDITDAVSKGLKAREGRLQSLNYQSELEDRVTNATVDLQHVHEELQKTKQYLENLLHSTADAILTINAEGKFEFANTGTRLMLGYTGKDLVGIDASEVLAGGADEVAYLRQVMNEQKLLQNYETELRHQDGHLVPVSVSLSLVPGADGKAMSILAICKDITEQRRLQHELREMSLRDSLTGLYNQRHFYEVLEREVERARRQHRPLSLLLFDVDKFKTYNDSRGHLEGDNVLRTIGQIVMECTREHVDTGFRYGGDEFTVILPETGESQAKVIAERIRKTFESKQFDALTLSIGIVQYHEDFSNRAFIQFADELMYDAKRTGGNQVFVYHPEKQHATEGEAG